MKVNNVWIYHTIYQIWVALCDFVTHINELVAMLRKPENKSENINL